MFSYRNVFVIAFVSSFCLDFVFPVLCECFVCCFFCLYGVQYPPFFVCFRNTNGYTYIFVCLHRMCPMVHFYWFISFQQLHTVSINQYFVCLCISSSLFVGCSSFSGRFATSFLFAFWAYFFQAWNVWFHVFVGFNTVAVVHYCLQMSIIQN